LYLPPPQHSIVITLRQEASIRRDFRTPQGKNVDDLDAINLFAGFDIPKAEASKQPAEART
jgi:hypothetical protein